MEILFNLFLLGLFPTTISLIVISKVRGLVSQFFLTVFSVFTIWILLLWKVLGYIDINSSPSFGVSTTVILSGLWVPAVLFIIVKILYKSK